jgi:hypothetical protein
MNHFFFDSNAHRAWPEIRFNYMYMAFATPGLQDLLTVRLIVWGRQAWLLLFPRTSKIKTIQIKSWKPLQWVPLCEAAFKGLGRFILLFRNIFGRISLHISHFQHTNNAYKVNYICQTQQHGYVVPKNFTPWWTSNPGLLFLRRMRCRLRHAARVARWFIFNPIIPIWVNFGGPWNGKYWYILWPFGIFNSHLVYFVAVWYIFSFLVCLVQEKSGNHARRQGRNVDCSNFFPVLLPSLPTLCWHKTRRGSQKWHFVSWWEIHPNNKCVGGITDTPIKHPTLLVIIVSL